MPWKESDRMSERLRFVARLEQGERMTDLCRELGISRKTGYKFWNRWKKRGVQGFDALADDSRAPHRRPGKTAQPVVDAIMRLKKKYPT